MRRPYIYHERQVGQLCALHALNNLFQRQRMFTKAQLDEYCYRLTPRFWLNPHRSWIGSGNYDINVIMYAIQQHGFEVIWFDRRRDPSCLNLSAIFGFIMNVVTAKSFAQFVGLPLKTRHWLALRRFEDSYYNLDSKLSCPYCIGDEIQFLNYLRQHIKPELDHELFIIISQQQEDEDVEQDDENVQHRCWLKPEFRYFDEERNHDTYTHTHVQTYTFE